MLRFIRYAFMPNRLRYCGGDDNSTLFEYGIEDSLGKGPAGARPHHSFHVLDVHSRLGELERSLATLDNCRVSWGRVVSIELGELVVNRVPLLLREGKLVLADPIPERITRQVDPASPIRRSRALDFDPLGLGM
jgi:hypothetical protein